MIFYWNLYIHIFIYNFVFIERYFDKEIKYIGIFIDGIEDFFYLLFFLFGEKFTRN